MGEVSAVLFASDHSKLAQFYSEAVGFVRLDGDGDHSVLKCGDFELVVHQIPQRYLGDAHGSEAVVRRENGRIRLDFPVESIDRSRSIAARFGGLVDDAPPDWAPRDVNFRLGHDPEGNVFMLIERPRESPHSAS